MCPSITRGGRADALTVDIDEVTHKSVSAAIVRSVAAYTEDDPDDLPRLGAKIDPEALDTILEPSLNDSAVVNTEVSFHYHHFEITVSSTGEIKLRPLDNTAE